ncbi:hypothetical protein [Brevundimonas sp. NPDC046655]|uniref:hypothetical protein n=1 Tax=unclassified Brevundimonas TaxID=2622653 RepID=UPI0038508480
MERSGAGLIRSDLGWATRSASRTQTFQTLEVSPEAVVYRAFTATGRELDAFRLTKGANGLARVDPGHEQ